MKNYESKARNYNSYNSKTLVILGNGFDIAHEIKSKYFDFYKFLEKRNESNLCFQCDKYFAVLDFWSNVEQALGRIDYSLLINEELSSLENASDREEDEERNRFGAVVDEFSCEFLILLTDLLNEWVLSFDYRDLEKKCSDIIDNNDFFLTFNYSLTLENLYRVNPANILHLHGKAAQLLRQGPSDVECSHSDLIIGHAIEQYDSLITKGHSFSSPPILHKSNPIRKQIVAENEPKIANYFHNSKKNTIDIIKHNKIFFNSIAEINKLIIIGHSLSDVDRPYFQEISQKLMRKDIAIIIYDCENELEERIRRVDEIFPEAKTKGIIL